MRIGTAVQPMPPMQKNMPTVRPCSEGSTWLSRIAISVGKIGPRINPAATIIAQVSQAQRLKTIPSVKAMHSDAIEMTSSVSAPSGSKSAVARREPMKASQKMERCGPGGDRGLDRHVAEERQAAEP